MSENTDLYIEMLNRTQDIIKETCPSVITYRFTRLDEKESPTLTLYTLRWNWLPHWCLRLGLPFVTKTVIKVLFPQGFIVLDEAARDE
jgi:hypothetical protein